jgi:hypothetical protein
VIELPAALAPWAAELSLLSSDLALMLAPWVGRLAVALGPMSEIRTSLSAEPDGYGGLSRRGSYERLITAEWALADAFPDEFLRRAAAGEHLFLDLARRGPRGALRSVAVVSAGPSQLGAPRLAHLAALVVLARRAASAGASFGWGLLEDPDARLRDGLDAAGIRRLLDGRTARSAGDAAIATWRAALGGDQPADWWLIGGDDVARRARPASTSCLIVRDLLEPTARALEVEVVRRGPPARLRLELPEADVCVRLLRDPLARGGGTRVAPLRRSAQRLRFIGRGLKLLVVGDDGSTTTWPIPGSPREPLGAARSLRHDGTTIALGMQGRTLMRVWVASDDPTTLRVSYGGAPPAAHARLPDDVAVELRAALGAGAALDIGECAEVRLRERHQDVVVEGPLGRMFLVPGVEPARYGYGAGNTAKLTATPFVTEPPGGRVLASHLRPRDALWAQIGVDGEVQLARTTPAGTAIVARVATAHGAGGAAVYFGRPVGGPAAWGPVAVRERGRDWRVLCDGRAPVTIQSDEPVSGVAPAGDRVRLLVQPAPGRLVWTDGSIAEELIATATPIEEVVVSAFEPRVAWRTASGEVVVYSTQHGAVLMRLVPSREGGLA